MELVNRPRKADAYQRSIIEVSLAALQRAVIAKVGHTDEVYAKIAALRDEIYDARGLIVETPRTHANLSLAVSTAFFQEMRKYVDASIWGFSYMDVVPLYFFDMDKWAEKKISAIHSVVPADKRQLLNVFKLPSPHKGILKSAVDMFTGADQSAYSAWLDTVVARIIRDKNFTRHNAPPPEAHFGPAVSSGSLHVEFDWSPCFRQRISRSNELHTWDIFPYLMPNWVDLMKSPVGDRVRHHYFIILHPLAARVMARVVGSITGDIRLIIADYRIEHVSTIFVTLGKYLTSWDVTIDASWRQPVAHPRDTYCQSTHDIPLEEIAAAMAIYLETAHKIYRKNTPHGKRLADGPFLPSNCIVVPDLPLYRQARALYNKYDTSYGAKCSHHTFSEAQSSALAADYVAKLLANAKSTVTPRRYTIVVAAPGTGKSTYLKTYVKDALLLVRDDIIEDIVADYTLSQATEETRKQLEADLAAINSPLAKYLRGNLSSRCRLCKDNFWSIANNIVDLTIKEIVDKNLPISVCVETVGAQDIIDITKKYIRSFDADVAFLRIGVNMKHRQQLGRFLVEKRVNDWYSIIKYSEMAISGFKQYVAMGIRHQIFIVSDDPPLLLINDNGKKIASIRLPYMDRTFNEFMLTI